jgi:hypothetical protein
MINRKTQRKNKTKQVITWPKHDEYFTIKQLVALNPHMLTNANKPSDITIRVRLKKAIDGDGMPKMVAEIGSKNTGLGRPIKAFAMMPVSPIVLKKAENDGIMPVSANLTPVIQVTSTTPAVSQTPVVAVTNIVNPKVAV